jgi:hypothetical protein
MEELSLWLMEPFGPPALSEERRRPLRDGEGRDWKPRPFSEIAPPPPDVERVSNRPGAEG